MRHQQLNDRERRVLEAVIQSYVETAEPAGSRMISRRFALGVSPATIRNTMSDLEDKGFLSHPHTSAGRVPTDMAYRVYVDSLIRFSPLDAQARDALIELARLPFYRERSWDRLIADGRAAGLPRTQLAALTAWPKPDQKAADARLLLRRLAADRGAKPPRVRVPRTWALRQLERLSRP